MALGSPDDGYAEANKLDDRSTDDHNGRRAHNELNYDVDASRRGGFRWSSAD